jgi:hypothetical protein
MMTILQNMSFFINMPHIICKNKFHVSYLLKNAIIINFTFLIFNHEKPQQFHGWYIV